jgi:hypothetical protein
MPAAVNIWSTGMSDIWSGTTSSPTTTMNRVRRSGNFTHAKA